MRYYLDENFPVLAQPVLEGGGAEVFRAVERQGHSSVDHKVLADAQALQAVLLTTDKDFFHREALLLDSLTASIVVIALRRPSSSSNACGISWMRSTSPTHRPPFFSSPTRASSELDHTS